MEKTSCLHAEAAPPACYHCGTRCENELVVFDDKSFCCDGCRIVYGILSERDLCAYYSMPDSHGNTPDQNLYGGKYDYLDQAGIRDRVVSFSGQGQTQVYWSVPSMHCSSCIWLLEHLHRLHEGVLSAVVNFPEKKVRILIDEERLSLGKLAALLASVGYEPYISLNDTEGRPAAPRDKSPVYKIGIAGFAFGNSMFLGLSDYFALGAHGLGKEMASVFRGLSLLLALPVFFYCASGFFLSAWKAVRYRKLNIDAPIALAILVTFTRSVAEIATNSGSGYLDSMTGIVFFMLVGRYFQNRTHAFISFERDYKSYFPVAVTVLEGETESQRQVTRLQRGDFIKIRNNELFPCDVRLVSDKALVDYSFVTGESEPVAKQYGELLYAGGRLCGPAVTAEVLKGVSASYLTELWNKDVFTRKTEERENAATALINRYFTLAVFLLGAAGGIYWMLNGEPGKGFDAMTTVWIVACPCALLLAETFTNGNLLRIFGKHGFYLKNAGVLERLARVDTLVFDKTGTITLPDAAEITYSGKPLSVVETQLVYSLCGQSSHPLSKLLAKHLLQRHPAVKGSAISPEGFREVPGAGLVAGTGTTRVTLGSARFIGAPAEARERDDSRVYVALGGRLKGYFGIGSRYREGLVAALDRLRRTGYALFLLSGDKAGGSTFLQALFGNPAQLAFSKSPVEKLEFIKDLQEKGHHVLMLGDGLNDAGALRQADVGVAVSDNVNNFTPACDAVLEGSRLVWLGTFVKAAGAGRRIVLFCFFISLIYNVIGLYFALQGKLLPVVAAILMPASSLSIILLTTFLSEWQAGRRLRFQKLT